MSAGTEALSGNWGGEWRGENLKSAQKYTTVHMVKVKMAAVGRWIKQIRIVRANNNEGGQQLFFTKI